MMEKTMVIDYDEYMNLYKLVDTYRDEVIKLKNSIQEKERFISQIKESADEVLVIEKTPNGEEISFKSDEKKLLEKLVDLYTKLQVEHLEINRELVVSENENNKHKEKLKTLQDTINNLEDSFKKLKKEVDFLNKRSFSQRLINKQYEK